MKLFHKLAAVAATTVIGLGVISASANAAGFRSCNTSNYDIFDDKRANVVSRATRQN